MYRDRSHWPSHDPKERAVQSLALRRRKREHILRAKIRPCADCKVQYPVYVMDFDHVRGIKKFNLSMAHTSKGWNAIDEEIKKCEVVCANCHRERTHSRTENGDKTK